ncbi:MAG: aminopeptidase [Gammaproteobacteria bacterium]|jgi:predicted aminopeptidase|nr:aminopeptidase [Gammaproteobacteria bacterium]MDP6535274.1 aminopeptidase [Gammaproteobacteria bacterium]MDP6732465.1 aminopeptidase [Gammaproteobacteria bacterium]
MIWGNPTQRANLIKLGVLILVSALLLSCETVGYYTQAARGQLAIVFGREDIQRLLSEQSLPADLRDKFNEVLLIREYALSELKLPVGENYASYVDVDREHVVWNVFAAPEFSTDPVNWCYPIAGCVSYRGYFSEAGAERYAAELAADGFDVYTGGIDAYSTLGWFDDSLLSTVLTRANYQLAGLIFHELAHQVVYVPGDTTFNESFATTIEREGLKRWLLHRNQVETIAQAQTDVDRQRQFVDLVARHRERLDTLYESDSDASEMRVAKARVQQQLRDNYEQLKLSWDGYAGYDNWFSRSLNNAQLSTVSSYNDLVPFFDDLLRQSGDDLQQFFDEVDKLARLSEEERQRRLEDWL